MPKGRSSSVGVLLELAKIRISLTVTLSALSVYLLAAEWSLGPLLALAGGVFLLAAGACALNEYQESDLDALMPRTQGRPIPSKRISPGRALGLATAAVLAGAATLYAGPGLPAMVLGLLGVFWYGAVYTPLKRVSAFAVVPGALVGAVAPAVGWAAAGEPLMDGRLLALCFFFFMWQVPHFWLLALRYGKEYSGAGFPAMGERFRPPQAARIIFSWTLSTAASCLLLPLFGAVNSLPVLILLAVAALWLAWRASGVLRGELVPATLRSTFVSVNAFMLFVMVLLSLDPWL